MAYDRATNTQLNVNSILDDLSMMDDRGLQQYAAANKNDTNKVALAIGESNNRKKLRADQQAQMAGMKQPPVVDQNIQQMVPPPQRMAQAQLPEQQGIGSLPAPNMARMADGGIAGYDDTPEQLAYHNEPVLRMAEGGVAHFAGGGLNDYIPQIVAEAKRLGIDPDVAINLFKTESGGNKNAVSNKGAAGLGQLMKPAAQEMGLSEEERFDPQKNIKASLGYFKKQLDRFGSYDKAAAAYNWGPGNVNKHLAKNEGILDRLSLPKETAKYLTKLMPGSDANAGEVDARFAAQGKPTTFDAVSQIPTGGKPGAGPTPALPEPEKGFFGRQADKLGLSEDTQRNISNLNNAFAGAMGPAYIPSYLPKTAGLMDLARSGGEKLYGRMFPAAGQMTEAQLKAVQATKAAEAAKNAQFAQEAQMAGALPGEFRAAEQGVNTAKAANAPSAAMRAQEASMAREAADAQRIQQAARLGQYGSQATADGGPEQAGATALDKVISADYGNADDQSFGVIDRKGPKTPDGLDAITAAAAAGKEKKSRFNDDDLLMLGLGMMANNKPGTGNKLGDLMASAGQAGIGAVAAKREREKSEREDLYRQALGREAVAKADYYGSLSGGSAVTAQAMKAANDLYDNWINSLDKMGKMELQQRPEIAQQKQQEFLRQAFAAFKMEMPATLAGGAPAAASQSDPLGILGRKG